MGDPVVAGATVEASVVEDGKDKKVIVYKYKKMCIRDRYREEY